MSDSIPSGMTSPPLPSRDHRPRYPYRAKTGRHWAGVAKGLGQYLGMDANWIRLAFMVSTAVGGIGLAIYLGLWLALPEEGDAEAGNSLFRAGDGRHRALLGIALLCFPLAVVVGDGAFDGFTEPIALIVAGAALWIWRMETLKRREQSPGEWAPPTIASPTAGRGNPWAPPSSGARTPAAPAARATPSAPAARSLPPPTPPVASTPPPTHFAIGPKAAAPSAPRPPARPPEPRSPLGALTFATSLLVFAGAVLVDRFGWFDVTPSTALGLALAVTAGGLIAGIWFGRARGMIGWGIVLSLGVIVTSAVGQLDLPFTAGIGEKRRAPQTLTEVEADYVLSIGSLEVDLSAVDFADARKEIDISLAIGEIKVYVPDDVTVEIETTAGVGSVRVFDHNEEGVGSEYSVRSPGDEGAGTVVLDVSAGLGEVVVERRSGS